MEPCGVVTVAGALHIVIVFFGFLHSARRTIVMEGIAVDVSPMYIVLILWLICAGVSARMASKKGYSYYAFLAIGLVTGIIGLIVAAVIPDRSNTSASDADALLKYKELLDKGVITQAEFNKKKSELLNS